MSTDFLSPMMIRDSKKLVFLNFELGKVYEIKVNEDGLYLSELDNSTSSDCFVDLENQRKEIEPELPVEQILGVLRTEKDLSQQNEKHIFRRAP